MKKRKIRILIICAVLAANLAACALPGGKTPADVEDGGTAEETMISSEASTQDKLPQRSDDEAQDRASSQKRSGQKIETEVHFLLDSDAVLDEDHKLKKEIRSEFDTGKKIKQRVRTDI